MEFLNLTPHAICVEKDGELVNFPSSGEVARLQTEVTEFPSVGGFSVESLKVVGHNLPEEREGVTLIVSAMILSELKGKRGDLVAPNTNKATRNEKGHIVSVPGFVR